MPQSLAPNSAALDGKLQEWLNVANAQEQPATLTPQDVRHSLTSMSQEFGGEGPEVASVEDACIPIAPMRVGTQVLPAAELPVRLYTPRGQEPKGVLVYLHGGGHTAGSIAVYDPILRHFCDATKHLVVAIGYRLAPEHPYPTALQDCLSVLTQLPQWLQAKGHQSAAGLALAGDSAGGALTASICARTNASALGIAGAPGALSISHQILIYPSLDYTMAQPSIQTLCKGYLLEADRIAWYFDNYLPRNLELRRAASALFMPMHALPPTLMVTAGYCPLRDEGFAYVKRLQQAGIAHQHLHVPDIIHASLNLHTLVPKQCMHIYYSIGQFLGAEPAANS